MTARDEGRAAEANIGARVAETVSVVCPVCGRRESFSPIVEAVTVRSARQHIEPTLLVSLQPGNLVAHACIKPVSS